MKKGEAKANGDAGGGLEENRLLFYTVHRKGVSCLVGYIYIIWSPSMKGMVKLGYTADLQSRLNNINA